MAEDSERILYDDKHKYKLLKQINVSKGACGDIFLAEDLEDNKAYAVKFRKFKKESRVDKLFFEEEIKILEYLSKKQENKKKYISKLYVQGSGIIKEKKGKKKMTKRKKRKKKNLRKEGIL